MNQQKVALITGGSRGIGACIVKTLVADGFAVAVNYSSSAEEAEILVADIKANGGNALAVKCNVANSVEVENMFNTVENQLGKINVLVNNAGVMKLATLAQSNDELFDS